MPLNDPPLNYPDPDSIPDVQKSSWAGKSPGSPATPTDVYVPTRTEPVERVRTVKRNLHDGMELFLAVDGSGRVFRRRQCGNLGVEELTPEEYVTLAGHEPEEGDED
jgi:hypothetical protein